MVFRQCGSEWLKIGVKYVTKYQNGNIEDSYGFRKVNGLGYQVFWISKLSLNTDFSRVTNKRLASIFDRGASQIVGVPQSEVQTLSGKRFATSWCCSLLGSG